MERKDEKGKLLQTQREKHGNNEEKPTTYNIDAAWVGLPLVRGTCMLMCSESEFCLRKREKLLHPFEMNEDRTSADQKLAVKWYSRSAAGQQYPKPCDIRPIHVLKQTVNYLLNVIMKKKNVDWIIVYDFIFDRLRAVRQDIVIQGIDIECIGLLEVIIRFYAYAGYKLCERPVAVFDPIMNKTHLLECLKWLLALYEADNKAHMHRNEFEALYLIFNLGSSIALHRIHSFPEIMRSPLVNVSYQMSLAYSLGNFVRVSRLMPTLPVWLAFVAVLHLPEIRRKALRTMSIAYNSRNLKFPCSKIASFLLYSSIDEVMHDCQHYNLPAKDESIIFTKQAFDETVIPVAARHEPFVEICLKMLANTNNFQVCD